jgi:hypothetical protein
MLILFIMCDCANCDGITLFAGTDGTGIASTSYNSGTGVLTIYYTDGTTYSTTSLIGPAGAAGAAGVCNCAPVKYVEERLGIGTSALSPLFSVLTNMTYTIPAGQAGTYELLFVSDAEFSFASSGSNQINLLVYKNGSIISTSTEKRVKMTGTTAETYVIPVSVLISNVALVVGDVIAVRTSSTNPSTAYLNFGVMKINKLT